MMHIGEFIPIFDIITATALEGAKMAVKQGSSKLATSGVKYFVNKGINELNKKFANE